MENIKSRKISLTLLIVAVIIFVITPLNIWSVISASKTQNMVLQSTMNAVENIGQVQVNNLNRRMESINTYFLEITQYEGDIYNLSIKENKTEFIISMAGFAREIRERMGTYNDADFFVLYNPTFEQIFLKSKIINTEGYDEIKTLIKNNINENGYWNTWFMVESDDVKWLMRTGSYNGIYFAAGINIDSFCDEVSSDISYKNTIVSVDDNTVVSADDSLISSIYIPERQVYLNIVVEKKEVLQSLPLLQRYNIAMSLFTFLAIPILIIILNKIVVTPLGELVNAMELLKSNSKKRIDTPALTSEFHKAYISFNDMADELVDLKIQNYEIELGKQRLELDNLQLHMNPHFLMNTFNLIFNLAQMKEYKNIQKMVLYLSNYFRYLNTKNANRTTVKEEIALICEYLEVASIQYINNFSWNIDVSDVPSDYEIPPLMLHNFVENFFKYGVTFERKCLLNIKGYVDKENVIFIIEDNGRGMNSNLAENMSNGIFEFCDGKHHMGIRTNYLRLKYLYGEIAELKISSDIDVGTKVTIVLPINNTVGV